MWQNFIDFFLPKKCVACGELEVDFCESCRKELAISEQICPVCGNKSPVGWTHEKCRDELSMDGLTVIYQYQDILTRNVIDTIKYDFNKRLIDEVLRDFVFEAETKFDLVASVPLYYYRKNWRGFNQAELIAKNISEKMGLVYKNVLRRVKNTKQQALMKTRVERFENVEGAFCAEGNLLNLNHNIRHVLLVDDVFTSGANMRECTRILKRAGVEFVWGLALAH